MARKIVTDAPKESWCTAEGRLLPIEDFYKSKSPRDRLGVQCMCKSCANDLINVMLKSHGGGIKSALWYTCASLDQPFVERLYDIFAEKQEGVKSTSNLWGSYVQVMNRNMTKAEKEEFKCFADSNMGLEELGNKVAVKKDFEEEKENLVLKWGAQYDSTQLNYLETRWEYYVQGKTLDVAQESLYRNLCLAELQIWEGGDDIDKAIKMQLSMFKALGIDSVDRDRSKSLGEAMLENQIFLMENYEPAEYYENSGLYDDFLGMMKVYVNEIKRPILNFITGSKDYNVEQEDQQAWMDKNSGVLDNGGE